MHMCKNIHSFIHSFIHSCIRILNWYQEEESRNALTNAGRIAVRSWLQTLWKNSKANLASLSRTSRFILCSWVMAIVWVVSDLTFQGHPVDIAVVVLVFVQPALILYFLYW